MYMSPQHPPHEGAAFAAVLWGDNSEHIVNALVLGFSLRQSKTQWDCVLLATEDVLDNAISSLLYMYWDVRIIKEVTVPRHFVSGADPRFSRVFNKLRAWELKYAKVCLLDTDILIAGDVDELLRLPSPTALYTGRELPQPGQVQREERNINAGVIIMEPHAKGGFPAMMKNLRKNAAQGTTYGTAPEQKFLSRYLAPWCESLDWKYNFQLHQLLITARNRWQSEDVTRMRMNLEAIRVFHYSTKFKPSTLLCDPTCSIHKYKKHLKEYLAKWKCTRQETRTFIENAFGKWFDKASEMWEELLDLIADTPSVPADHSCRLCGAPGINYSQRQHAWAECRQPDVQKAISQWRQKVSGSDRGIKMLSLYPRSTMSKLEEISYPNLKLAGQIYMIRWKNQEITSEMQLARPPSKKPRPKARPSQHSKKHRSAR